MSLTAVAVHSAFGVPVGTIALAAAVRDRSRRWNGTGPLAGQGTHQRVVRTVDCTPTTGRAQQASDPKPL